MGKEIQIGGHFVYDKDQMIGQGAYGQVYICKDLNNPTKKLCAKVIEQKIDDDKVLREVNIMKMLITEIKKWNNENIVIVEHVEVTDQSIIIIMELCDNDLEQKMKEMKLKNQYFTPFEALDIIKQIILGYKLLFINNIIHRDLKPANILIKGTVYKIADLGLARVYQEGQKDLTKVGTPKYAAPQLFLEPTFSNSADIYSIGIIFYELIFGDLPYKVRTLMDIKRELRKIKNDSIKIPSIFRETQIPIDIAQLIESMLKYDEKDRISWEQLFHHKLIQNSAQQQEINSSSMFLDSTEDEVEDQKNQVQEQVENKQQQQVQQPVQQQQQFPQTFQIQPQQQQSQFPKQQIEQQQITPQNETVPKQQFQHQNIQFNPPQNIQFGNQIKPNFTFQPLTQFQQNKLILPKYNCIPDQIYTLGQFFSRVYELFQMFQNLQTQRYEFVVTELQIYNLTCCFFEHCQAQKEKTTNNQIITFQVVQQEYQKFDQHKQQMLDKIQQLKFPIQIFKVGPSYGDYAFGLVSYYEQLKSLFPFSSTNSIFYLEYLQLLFILEKMSENKEKFKSYSDFYQLIQEISSQITNEQFIKGYLKSRR